MRKLFSILYLIISFVLLSGCQTSLLKNFGQINNDMDKDQVLQLMGNPEWTQRFHGKDRWNYVFYEDQIRYEKEVQFQNGRVVYFGNIWEPKPENSAVVADQKIDEIEKQYQSAQEKMIAAKKEAPLQYEKYQKEASGEDSVKYMPEFTPVK